MKIEHLALHVADPLAVAAWYCEHLALRVVRHLPQSGQTHFLADDDSTILEIYCNPSAQVPDYHSMEPLVLHLAFASHDPISDSQRLISAGASLVGDTHLADGSHMIMLRDPWGLALQLCKRTTALLPGKAD